MSELKKDDTITESLLTFPTDFPIKVMGRKTAPLVQIVAEAIAAQVSDFDPTTISLRESKEGTFIAVTATFTATSKAQIDAIYQALSKNPAVLMVL